MNNSITLSLSPEETDKLMLQGTFDVQMTIAGVEHYYIGQVVEVTADTQDVSSGTQPARVIVSRATRCLLQPAAHLNITKRCGTPGGDVIDPGRYRIHFTKDEYQDLPDHDTAPSCYVSYLLDTGCATLTL